MYSLPQSYNQTSKCKRCISSNAYVYSYAYICSLLATCKAQEVNPREWLNDVIARLPYYQEKDSGKNIRELLPDIWKLKKSNENPIEV